MKRTFAFLGLFFAFSWLEARELQIAVASNFYSSMQEIAQLFEQQSPHKLTLISGSSGKLYSQILHGAPFDVFFSADTHKPKSLEAKNLIVPQSRFTYARGQLALLSSKTYPELSLLSLESQDFSKLIYANPKLAPYGAAAEEVLAEIPVANQLQKIQAENINQALIYLLNTNDAIGFVAYSQIIEFSAKLSTRSMSWKILSEDLYSPIVQQAVVLRESQASEDFVNFLKSREVQSYLESGGYLLN